jgi:O-antigen/teichoic acid export membrane protein
MEARGVSLGAVETALAQEPAALARRTSMSRRLASSPVTRRGFWIAGDEAISSLTNFGLSILVLRSVSTADFGAFTITYTAYAFALNICRGLVGEPQLVRHSHVEIDEWRETTKQAVGTAFVLGVGGAALLLGVVPILYATGGELSVTAGTLLPLAILLPALLVQDSWRYVFFAIGRPSRSFFNDLVWGISQAGLLFLVFQEGDRTAPAFLLAWGGAAAVAAVFGLVQAAVLPRPMRAWAWLVSHKDLGPRFTAEFIVDRGSSQVMLVIVAGVSGFAAVGLINAARVALGPINFLFAGTTGFGIPEGIRIWRSRPERLEQFAWALGISLVVVAVACGATLYFMPLDFGIELFGKTWSLAHGLIPLVTAWVAGAGLIQGARVGLRVHAAARQALAVKTAFGLSILGTCTLGAVLDGAWGASAALAFVSWCAALAWWWQFRRVNRLQLHHMASPQRPGSDLERQHGSGKVEQNAVADALADGNG